MRSASDDSSKTRWRTVMLVVGAGVVAAFQVGRAPAGIPALRADLDLSLFESGWVISLLNLLAMTVGRRDGDASSSIAPPWRDLAQ